MIRRESKQITCEKWNRVVLKENIGRLETQNSITNNLRMEDF